MRLGLVRVGLVRVGLVRLGLVRVGFRASSGPARSDVCMSGSIDDTRLMIY